MGSSTMTLKQGFTAVNPEYVQTITSMYLVGNGKVAFRAVYTSSVLFISLQTFKESQIFARRHPVDAFE